MNPLGTFVNIYEVENSMENTGIVDWKQIIKGIKHFARFFDYLNYIVYVI